MAKRQENETAATIDKLRRHARILTDIGRIASQKLTLQGFLDQCALQVARAVEIDHVKIMRHRPERADLLAIAGTGWKPGVIGTARFPVNLRSAPGRAFQTGEPVIISDAADTPEFRLSPILVEHGIVALANVPILVDGTSWGILEVDSTQPRDFSLDTVNFLRTAAMVLGAVARRDEIAEAETQRLAAAAAETQRRDLLLAEIQHRTKNNLQIVLSIIAMQKKRVTHDETQRALDHIANRINAISIAHEQLGPKQDQRSVNLAVYVRALSSAIEQQLDAIGIDLELDEVVLLVDRAIPLGLILNEAIVNSAKHAFGPEGGRIAVRLINGIGRGEARLSVADNGKGIDPARPAGSGTRLMQSLVAQLGGTIEQDSSGQGTLTTVTFPVVN